MKLSEAARGVPLVAHAVQTASNRFVLELSDLAIHRQQNLSLLTERTWLDIPIFYNDGHRAIVTLSKEASGLRAFNEALGLPAR